MQVITNLHNLKSDFNPFLTNVPFIDKPGSWFLLNVTLPQVFFKHFACKNQLLGFYISRTLIENGLKKRERRERKKTLT